MKKKDYEDTTFKLHPKSREYQAIDGLVCIWYCSKPCPTESCNKFKLVSQKSVQDTLGYELKISKIGKFLNK